MPQPSKGALGEYVGLVETCMAQCRFSIGREPATLEICPVFCLGEECFSLLMPKHEHPVPPCIRLTIKHSGGGFSRSVLICVVDLVIGNFTFAFTVSIGSPGSYIWAHGSVLARASFSFTRSFVFITKHSRLDIFNIKNDGTFERHTQK